MTPLWREDIDSLAFRPARHAGWCVVHRLAFRAFLGPGAARDECLAFFVAHEARFDAAAAAKIGRAALGSEANFHLTSRDLRKALGGGPGAARFLDTPAAPR